MFPFAPLDGSWRYPAWIRGLRRANGVYLFKERNTGEIVYIGESHSDRLYATLTRHFQQWTNKFHTAGATYARDEVEVAVIVVPSEHAYHLQNELICALRPRDNRLQCDDLFDWHAAEAADQEDGRVGDDDDDIRIERGPPEDYEYDIDLLIHGIDYEFTDDVPF